jgi:uncharacterized membrane protein YesL
VIVPTFAHFVLDYVPEVLNLLMHFVHYALNVAKRVQQNVINTIWNVAKNAPMLAKNVQMHVECKN